MNRRLIVILGILIITACRGSLVPTKNSVPGEWAYVGTFSHLADYTCYVCPGFKPDDSLYKLAFTQDGQYNGRINLLITEGSYAINTQKLEDQSESGEFVNLRLQILNKPLETEADSKFKEMFQNASTYHINYANRSEAYDMLSLGKDSSTDFLLFVRTK